MPAPSSSILLADYVIVRLRESVNLRGRLMTKHGQHGSLVALAHGDALRLVESGQCKPIGGVSMRMLKEHLEEQPA